MRLYAKVGQALIRAKEAGNDAFIAIEQILSWEQFTENLREAEKLARSEDFDYLAILGDHYPQLRRYLPANPENTADIQAKATNLANALSTSSVQTALHRTKINQVLTPAQRVVLDDARERPMRRWRRPDGGEQRGPWQQRRPWQRQNQSPQQTPAAPQDSQTPADPTS